ncbi:T9SS type A sorting domain-containing protein [bacterium]|nr:T9SS type A sorting domain-containing protein [bacterium]
MKRVIIVSLLVVWGSIASADFHDQWDLEMHAEISGACDDHQLQGVEFVYPFFFVTGGNDGEEPNKVYVLFKDGTYVTEFDQWNSDGWGWKGLCQDGMRLYACQHNVIYAFDVQGNPLPNYNITTPFSSCDALAYDPILDHFWIIADGQLHTIDRDGLVIQSMPVPAGSVGLAWDCEAPDGPWLWIFCQTGYPASTIFQFDPINLVLTGFSYQVPLLPGAAGQVAGDLFFTDENWFEGISCMGGLMQATPEDQLFVLEMYLYACMPPPDLDVEMDLLSSPIIPESGGDLILDLTIVIQDSIYTNINLALDATYLGSPSVTLVERTLSDYEPGMIIERTNVRVPISSTWAGGIYSLLLNNGLWATNWEYDGFGFIKEGVAESGYTASVPDDWANPFYIDAEVSATAGKAPFAPTDDQWDLLFETNAGVTCSDNQLLGAEFAVDKFYVTGGNNAAEPNQVYVLDADGDLLFQFDQWSADGWGWRDLVYDGTYLYGSDDDTLSAFDLDGNPVHEMDILAPLTPARGLAHDPATDHFWSGSFSSPLFEFDREGNLIWSGSSGLSGIYGLAWDQFAPDGPWLWIFDQSGTPSTTFYQFDPDNHVLTGLSYTVPLIGTSVDQIAGGAFLTNEFDISNILIGGLTQGTPDDQIFLLEMYWYWVPPSMVNLVYQSGSPVPASGGQIIYDLYIENNEMIPISFDAWLDVEHEGGDPITLVQRHIDNMQPWWVISRESMVLPIPSGWPGGTYELYCRMGIYPGDVWCHDFFSFFKLPGSDGRIQPWVPAGVPNPFDQIIKDGTVQVVTEFKLIGAYPNPFNPTTTISYALPAAGTVELSVFDISGREVAKLVDGYRDEGVHEVQFDASCVSSGIYFCRLTYDGRVEIEKLVLMK